MYDSRVSGHDLTPFLTFALPAITARCNALADQIVTHSKRLLYRQFAQSLFGRLRNPRRRALAERQLQLIEILLDSGPVSMLEMTDRAWGHYTNLKFPDRALLRDLIELTRLSAVSYSIDEDYFELNLEWPRQFSESELLLMYEQMPSAASASHPAMSELSRLLGRRR